MKVIEVKINNELVICEQLKDLTTARFLENQRKVAKFWKEKDSQIAKLKNEVSVLKEVCQEHKDKLKDLQHQINVIIGIEEESEEHE